VNAILGWALAAGAIAAGWLAWGWPGVALGVTVVVFWLLLQFSRTLRVLRIAAQRPVGTVDSTVMLQARVRPGMRLLEILPLTRSLGRRIDERPDAQRETWAWADAGGDEVRVTLMHGRVSEVHLHRAAAPGAAPGAPQTLASPPSPHGGADART
jgi:hypothetical protein